MSKWHAHDAHMAKHMDMVGSPGPGTLGPPQNPALTKVEGKKNAHDVRY